MNHPSSHLHDFARLVRELRRAQRSGGKGYKTPADHDRATPLEKRVDHAIECILNEREQPRPAGTPGN